MHAFKTMLKTEWKLSLRGMDMMLFVIGMPVVLTVILGVVFAEKPAFEGAGYSFFAQSFGAVSAVGICAAGVMGLPLVLADYRNKKILKRFRTTPVSPVALLAVQVTVNLLYSLLSLLAVSVAAALFFGYRMAGSPLLFFAAWLLVLVSLFSIGLLIAGVAPNLKSANILCMILYFPMLIFSGATLPYEIMPRFLQNMADVMPLTQGIKLLKSISLGMPQENAVVPMAVMGGIALICTICAVKFFRWE